MALRKATARSYAPLAYRGCDRFGFAPNDTDPVADLSAQAREAPGGLLSWWMTRTWLESIGVDAERRQSLWRQLQNNRSDLVSPPESFELLLDEISDLIPPRLQWLTNQPVLDVHPGCRQAPVCPRRN